MDFLFVFFFWLIDKNDFAKLKGLPGSEDNTTDDSVPKGTNPKLKLKDFMSFGDVDDVLVEFMKMICLRKSMILMLDSFLFVLSSCCMPDRTRTRRGTCETFQIFHKFL
jgi:hypothetical protein